MKNITVQELREKLAQNDDNDVLLDVREPYEHKGTRIQDSENVPLDTIQDAVSKLKGFGTVYVHCGTGGRSARACELLEKEGVNVVNVAGGIKAWQREGFAVVKNDKQIVPIMRQVMIVAGSLALLGFLLGVLVHPWWHGLSAFVGVGLLFAGISGICFTSILLSYMPWNRPH